jgi:RNA recognition motif-containing protein
MTRLYIGNVSTKVDTSELKELLSECGKIKQFDIKEGSGFMVKILSLTVY